MKQMIKILLVLVMILEMTGCKQIEVSQPAEEDVQIESFDYDQYLVYPVESYKGKSLQSHNPEKKLASFNEKLMEKLINNNENTVYSPINLYLNFCALASVAEGNGKDELLNMLDTDENSLLGDYHTLWKDHYVKTNKRISIFNNSFWLSENVVFNDELLKEAADNYFVTAYRGNMADQNFTKAFQSWLNDNTGGILGNHISELKFDPTVLMALASTIYYEGKWYDDYDPSRNTMEVFHGAEKDIKTEFMHKATSGFAVKGSNFTGFVDQFADGDEYMMFIMPDQGTSITETINSEEFREVLRGPFRTETVKPSMLRISLPKYDTDSKFKLEEVLPELGVRDIFNPASGTFGKLTDSPMAVDKIEHACRLILDEYGVKAAAYTVELKYGGAPSETFEIKLDRPFIFVVLSGNTVMFFGVINQL